MHRQPSSSVLPHSAAWTSGAAPGTPASPAWRAPVLASGLLHALALALLIALTGAGERAPTGFTPGNILEVSLTGPGHGAAGDAGSGSAEPSALTDPERSLARPRDVAATALPSAATERLREPAAAGASAAPLREAVAAAHASPTLAATDAAQALTAVPAATLPAETLVADDRGESITREARDTGASEDSPLREAASHPVGATSSDVAAGSDSAAASPQGMAGTSLGGLASAGGGTGQLTDSPAGISYFAAISQKVERNLRFPRRALRNRIEGVVLVELEIDRRGRVLHSDVVESSGSTLLDRDALRTVGRAEPFGAVPDSVTGPNVIFELPITYETR